MIPVMKRRILHRAAPALSGLSLMVTALLATPAAATPFCDDLWYTRNLVVDRAGYCFTSPLGRAVFDNRDCHERPLVLSPDAAAFLDRVRAQERAAGCRVDTRRTALDLADLRQRASLRDLPLRRRSARPCGRWQGAVTPLHAGHDRSAPVTGRVRSGDALSFAHEPVGDWAYVTVLPEVGEPRSGGSGDDGAARGQSPDTPTRKAGPEKDTPELGRPGNGSPGDGRPEGRGVRDAGWMNVATAPGLCSTQTD